MVEMDLSMYPLFIQEGNASVGTSRSSLTPKSVKSKLQMHCSRVVNRFNPF